MDATVRELLLRLGCSFLLAILLACIIPSTVDADTICNEPCLVGGRANRARLCFEAALTYLARVTRKPGFETWRWLPVMPPRRFAGVNPPCDDLLRMAKPAPILYRETSLFALHIGWKSPGPNRCARNPDPLSDEPWHTCAEIAFRRISPPAWALPHYPMQGKAAKACSSVAAALPPGGRARARPA